jgi:hypothetical protein
MGMSGGGVLLRVRRGDCCQLRQDMKTCRLPGQPPEWARRSGRRLCAWPMPVYWAGTRSKSCGLAEICYAGKDTWLDHGHMAAVEISTRNRPLVHLVAVRLGLASPGMLSVCMAEARWVTVLHRDTAPSYSVGVRDLAPGRHH